MSDSRPDEPEGSDASPEGSHDPGHVIERSDEEGEPLPRRERPTMGHADGDEDEPGDRHESGDLAESGHEDDTDAADDQHDPGDHAESDHGDGHREQEQAEGGEHAAPDDAVARVPPEPVTFDRQPLASTVRWVWLGGYLVPVAILSLIAAQLEVLVLQTTAGLVTAATLVTTVGLAVWRTVTRYRAWSWELTERQLIIDRGVVFELTRIVPRARVQHVDISSGPLDRFFGLRQLSIYTAGTREADASIPGLTADRAEELRAALIGS